MTEWLRDAKSKESKLLVMKKVILDELVDLEEDEIVKLLKVGEDKLNKIAFTCNRYPDIKLEVDENPINAQETDPISINFRLQREGLEENEKLSPVTSFVYPETKSEYWWVVAGDPDKNKLLAVKRITFERDFSSELKFEAPEEGNYNLVIYLICDSYLGCDQESEKIQMGITKVKTAEE